MLPGLAACHLDSLHAAWTRRVPPGLAACCPDSLRACRHAAGCVVSKEYCKLCAAVTATSFCRYFYRKSTVIAIIKSGVCRRREYECVWREEGELPVVAVLRVCSRAGHYRRSSLVGEFIKYNEVPGCPKYWPSGPPFQRCTPPNPPPPHLSTKSVRKSFFFFSFHPYRRPTLYSVPSFNLKLYY